ncbi:GNAT family N-acetyltransferase, partial [Phaeovulum sp.]|uniref:GNAT family N-acetyltransferase n=1 Tax=Phaeovulum sp. TaxID=2934796 RepID=UPI00356AD488
RLVLRRAQASDLEALHRVFGEPRAMRYWSRPAHENLAQTEATLAAMQRAEASDEFVVEHDGAVIGKVGAWRLPEIGFILHPDHWGKGLAREALSAVIDHLFACHPIAALTADADPRNARCLHLLGALGFSETHREERTVQWGDEWCDSVWLALPRAVWKSRSA